MTIFLQQDVELGIVLYLVLGLATLWVLSRMGKGREALMLFGGAMIFHGVFVLFLHYTGFQPFTGGDYSGYHISAQQVAERFRQGIFSLEGLRIPHAYPVIVGVLYALLVPSMVIGQFFNAWLGALTVVLLYFLAKEVGASKRWAMAIGLIGMVYPSFVFFGNLLLKERMVTVFTLAALLLSLRMLQSFSWRQVPFLFFFLTALTNFRFYIGMVFIFVFLISWLLFSEEPLLRRALTGFVLFLLLGFVPLLNGSDYYAATFITRFLEPDVARYYKEEVFNPKVNYGTPVKRAVQEAVSQLPNNNFGAQDSSGDTAERASKESRNKSSVNYLSTGFENPGVFLWNYVRSFALAALGPFPWHIKTPAQSAALLETIPWLALAVLAGKGIFEQFRQNFRSPSFLLVLFALAILAVLAFYFNNFGILMRIRVPAVLALLPFISLAFHPKPITKLK